MIDFVNIHTHSNLGSMLDSLISVNDLFNRAKEFGQKAIAITDHGTLAAHHDAFQAYKKTGVKFIPGCEMYFVNSYEAIENKGGKGRKKTEKRKHIVLLAKNHIGYKNLLMINYIGFQNQILMLGKSFARVNWEVLEKYSDGIICTSACVNGIVANLLLNNNYDGACEAVKKLNSIFKSGFYIEIQPHLLKDDFVDQHSINLQLINIAKKFNIPLVVGVDVHYLDKNSEKYHDVLLAVKQKVPIDDPNRHKYGIDEFYVKNGEEIHEFLSERYGKEIADEAVSNTVKIADLCEPPDYMEVKGNHLPIFNPKEEDDYQDFLNWKIAAKLNGGLKEDAEYMRFKIFKGFEKKFKSLSREEIKIRLKRIKDELKILEGNDFSSYMLIVSDFIKWAKTQGILVGCGRGCLSGENLVLTENGFKRLDNVKIGDYVYTNDGNLKIVEDFLKYKIDNEKLLEIKTDYSFNNIVLTKDHEVYGSKAINTRRYNMFLSNNWSTPFKGKKYDIENPSWIPINNLKENDFIFMPFPNKKVIDVENFDLSKFLGHNDSVENNIIYSKISISNSLSIREVCRKTGLDRGTIKRIKYNKKYLNNSYNIVNEYLLNNNSNVIDWQKDENCIIRKIDNYLNCDEEFCYILGRWIGDGWITDKHNSYSIGIALNSEDEIGKNRILNYFKNKGFYCNVIKHKKKKLNQLYVYGYILAKLFRDLFPEYLDSSSTKYIGNFKYLPNNKLKNIIDGLIDSDGFRGKYRINIDTTSIKLLNDIRESLLYLKIPSYVSTRKEHISDNYLCKESYKIRFKFDESFRLKNRFLNNGYFVKIKEIKEVDRDFVYDLKIKDNFSYITQNFLVHNSAGGSLVAYLLDIHNVDPLEYGLIFERFQNAYKKDLPDIDTDFTSAGRDLVQKYCRNKYGYDHCAQVSNINKYTPKSVIPNLVKSMRNVMPDLIPAGENYVKLSNAIKDLIPEKDKEGKNIETLEQAISLSPKLKELADKCPDLMDYADKLIGLPKEFSTHAAGMVISDIPIVEFAPVRIDKNGIAAVQYEKNRCESIGLVKMDFLALSTLDVIDETIKNIKKTTGNDLVMEEIPLDDVETYKMIQEGQTKCVFQLGNSSMMISLCKSLKPKNIVDIAVINALGRPSSSKEEREEYVARRFGGKRITYLHPALENSLKETYGLCVFEEQMMYVAKDIAGWDLSKADGLRKLTKLKGKNPKMALQLENDFINGIIETHNTSYEEAKTIWEKIILPFAGYGFNKSHAIQYSINSYYTAFLKRHFPAEFFAAYLKIKTNMGGIHKDIQISMAKAECKVFNIKIIPPDINNSGSNYEVLDRKTIVMGFSAIKGLGEKGVINIVANQPYSSFSDFLLRTEGRVINKLRMEALAKSGCFDKMNVARRDIFEFGKKNRDKFNLWVKKNYDGYEENINCEEFPLKFENVEWSIKEKLQYEMEVFGELISGDLSSLYPGFFTGIGSTLISQLKQLPNRHNIVVEFLVVELLREFKIGKGKYTGQKMIKYRVSDVNGAESELTVWPTEYDSAKKFMKDGVPIRAQCQISDFNGVKTLMLRSIEKVYKDA